MRHAIILALVLLTTACAPMTGSETSSTICRELRRDLPTFSTNDTEQTKLEAAQFLDVFAAVCPD